MTRANVILSSFNAGELSPLIGGQPQLERYQAGLATCENFIPRVQGALMRRGGTRFVSEVKDSGKRPWFVRFVYAVNDAFVLEFGNTYIRFYRDHEVLLHAPAPWDDATNYGPGDFVTDGDANYYCTVANTGQAPPDTAYWRSADWDAATAYDVGDVVAAGGVNYYCKLANTNVTPPNGAHWYAMDGDVYEIPSPYVETDLVNAKDGSFAIRYTQSGDVIYLAHPRWQPRKLIRYGNLSWKLELYQPDGGPFQNQNEDETIKVWANAGNVGNSATICASAGIFLPGHVGSLVYLQMQDGGDVKPWEVYQPVSNPATSTPEVRSSDDKYYRCTAVGPGGNTYTGTEKPIHTSGAYWDGDGVDRDDDDNMGAIGAEWLYLHPGYGWARITAYSSPTHVSAIIVSQLPDQVVSADHGATNTTWRWALPAWSDQDGWPNAVGFFRDRLAWSKGQTVYFSQAGDYENFKAKDFGEQLPSSAFEVLVQSGQGDAVEWLAPAQRLLVGTGGSIHAIGEESTAQAFSATNARQEDHVMPGCCGIQPVAAGTVLYAEVSGRIVNEAAFSADDAKFDASDLTVFAEHITRSGLTAMAFQKQPHAIVWCVRADGALVGLTFHKEQKVIGWHRQPVAGSVAVGGELQPAVVEHVSVIPSPDGTREDVWLLVRRTIDGATKRYVEYVVPEYQDGDDQALSAYADCHLVYDGEPSATLSGLDHLEGCAVQVKADGAAHRDCVVAGGQITLDAPAAKAVVGLASPARAMLMPIEAGAQLGTAQAQLKRIHKTTLRLVSSLGGAVGPDFDTLQPLEYRWPHDVMDAPPPLLTGDLAASFPGDYDGRATAAVVCDQGFPFTLIAIVAELATYEG